MTERVIFSDDGSLPEQGFRVVYLDCPECPPPIDEADIFIKRKEGELMVARFEDKLKNHFAVQEQRQKSNRV